MTSNPAAGKPADPSILVFGTSGHRGSAFDVAFNEWHILAISQAICDYRKLQNIPHAAGTNKPGEEFIYEKLNIR